MFKNLGKYSITANEVTTRAKMPVTAGFSSSRSAGGASVGANIVGNYTRSVVDDFVNPDDATATRSMYRDIYYHDSVAGSAVDLLSTLPWSDFTLTGVPDAKQLQVYAQSIENLGLKSLLPEISIDFLVQGAFIGVLNFDREKGIFTSIMPQDVAMCMITELPVYGMDPLIDVRIPPNIVKLLQQAKRDPRLDGLTAKIPDFIVNSATKGNIQLNPANTLYIPRRTLSTTAIGTSYYRRILPLYILEKALLRGTIESAYRRQRGILHLVCLAGDTHVRVNDEERRLDSICSREGLQPGTRVPVNFITDGYDGPVRVTHWVYQGVKPTLRLETPTTHLTGTPDHLVLTLIEGRPVWQEIQNLKVGDWLYCETPALAERVSRIFPGIEQHVYDLTIEAGNQPAFIANGIMVHNCGDSEWEPTNEELTAINSMFIAADQDPTGAVISTRDGIQVNEVRCLDFSTQISTPSGPVRIGEIVKHDPAHTNIGMTKIDLEVMGLRGPVKAVEWHFQGTMPVYTYHTASIRLTCTAKHKVLALNSDVNINLLPIGELGTGYLCLDNDGAVGVPWAAFLTLLDKRKVQMDGNRTIYANDYNEMVAIDWIPPADPILNFAEFDTGAYKQILGKLEQISHRLTGSITMIVGMRYRLEQITHYVFEGNRPTYDITIESKHPPIFVANHVLVKNSGDDFWRYDSIYDFLTGAKLKALGVTESLISGEACLVGRTLIPTSQGLLRIGELATESEAWQPINYRVTGRYDSVTANKWLYNGERHTLKILADDGTEICASDNHPFLVPVGNGFEWKRADELEPGTPICVNVRRLVRTEPLELPTNSFCDTMNPDLAYLLALTVTIGREKDSALTFNNSALLAKRELLLTRLVAILERLGIHHQELVTEPEFNRFIQRLGGFDHNVVPWSILQADEQSQLAYVAAYVDLTSNFTRPTIVEFRDVLLELKTLLNSHGIIGHVQWGALTFNHENSEKLAQAIAPYSVSNYEFGDLIEPTESQFYTTQVATITPNGVHKVYDISIADGQEPAFVANGIIVHNSYSNMETALTVFIEQLRSFREMIVRRIFMTKVFPALAVANDFRKTKKQKMETTGRVWRGRQIHEIVCDGNSFVPDMKDVDITEYHIPRVNWHKSLKPEADADYLGMLDTLKNAGVPVTVRQLASAAGVSLTELMGSLDEDLKLRQRIQQYQKKLPKSGGSAGGDGGDDGAAFASMLGQNRRVGLARRKFEGFELRDPDTKRVLSRKGREVLEEKIHKNTARALASIARKENAETRSKHKKKTVVDMKIRNPFGRVE